MTTFETVAETTRKFGTNSYLEVARKRLREEGETTTEFLVLARGFYERDGTKRWTKFVTIPDDADLREWLATAIREA